ncbi:hypothetical protein SISSUDRAFT_1067145 [Sistotremastrum suecicum HHB10207 ss-3]|uniref:Uncharacterized protein n=1 Tax=Sistotremastrum suecicum HHB10207 ss-3 TaxID=1314776 RepID=A0A165XG49_9AGAM|nr:hypothetical protein SISSUDRAFT_1067145 [Sistotremastrum suecicum HHB10207 ss-3]
MEREIQFKGVERRRAVRTEIKKAHHGGCPVFIIRLVYHLVFISATANTVGTINPPPVAPVATDAPQPDHAPTPAPTHIPEERMLVARNGDDSRSYLPTYPSFWLGYSGDPCEPVRITEPTQVPPYSGVPEPIFIIFKSLSPVLVFISSFLS